MTPEQAAKVATCSRPAIMAAIASGSLTAKKNNKNRWDIHEDDLASWMADRKRPTVTLQQVDSNLTVDVTESKLSEVLLENKVLQVKLDVALEQIKDLKADKDAWKKQAQDLAHRPSFWSRLFK